MSQPPGIDILPIRRALVSVDDKSGVADLGRELASMGVQIVSSGRTAAALREAGVDATEVSDVTGFPEMLGGRVKTLHPGVHAGILADKRRPDHVAELAERGIAAFDLVVSNLYPFRETVASGAADGDVVESIDIGGPAMVRAAAKNFESIGIVVSPGAYGEVLDEVRRLGGLSRATRFRLARQAFAHTAAYDAAISAWFDRPERSGGAGDGDGLPERLSLSFVRRAALRYGENPHQRGALYAAPGAEPLGGAEQLQGKEMSFNNWLDAAAAREAAASLGGPGAVIVKHHNPCGAAIAATPAEAYAGALEGDRVSAYGGIVAFNTRVDGEAARAMEGVFTEVVIAPAFAPEALETFGARANLRVVLAPPPGPAALDVRLVEGGALVQDPDSVDDARQEMRVVSTVAPTERQWRDLLFAWRIAAGTTSNAIVLAHDQALVGVGAGQMNRVYSVDIATRHAAGRAAGSSLASDAFFPFRDSIDRAAEVGVAAVIQPGGSIRDDEVIAAANEHGMAMVLTARRHFRH